jgi:methionyl-tRNA formyltransferase
MQIDAGLDTGDMLMKRCLSIGSDETAPELSSRMSLEGADALIETIDALQSGTARPEKQLDSEATLAPILRKEDGRVDWQRPASEIYNRMRGFTPWPGAYTGFRGQSLTLLRIHPVDSAFGLTPGTLMCENRRLFVGCGFNTTVELFEVQLAGKKRMGADAFVNGYRPAPGEILATGLEGMKN